MVRIVVLMVLALLIIAPLQAQEADSTALKFYVGTPQTPPIIYQRHQQGAFVGIIPEIFASMPLKGITIEYMSHNRNRGEMAMYDGLVDGTMLSKDWAKEPDKLLFSTPLFEHREFLFSRKEFGPNASLEQALLNRRVCARRGYIYPTLDKYFAMGTALRVDTLSEQHQLQMLLKGRCELMAMNELIAAWLIDTNELSENLYRYEKPTHTVAFTMAFNPKWADFVEQLNTHIQRLKDSEQMAQIIQRYAGGLDFAAY